MVLPSTNLSFLTLSHDTEFLHRGLRILFNGAYCNASLSLHLERDPDHSPYTPSSFLLLNTSYLSFLLYRLLALVLEGWVSRNQCLGYFDWCLSGRHFCQSPYTSVFLQLSFRGKLITIRSYTHIPLWHLEYAPCAFRATRASLLLKRQILFYEQGEIVSSLVSPFSCMERPLVSRGLVQSHLDLYLGSSMSCRMR